MVPLHPVSIQSKQWPPVPGSDTITDLAYRAVKALTYAFTGAGAENMASDSGGRTLLSAITRRCGSGEPGTAGALRLRVKAEHRVQALRGIRSCVFA